MESSSAPDALAALSDAPKPDWEGLHSKARIALIFGLLAVLLPPYLIGASVLLTTWDEASWPVAAKAALLLLGGTILIALCWRFANASHARTRFVLDADGLRIRRGVFWHSETLVPRSRVQHIDLNRGPLDRRFGLASLKVYTAGTKLASVSIDGLPAERAAQLRDALVAHDDAD